MCVQLEGGRYERERIRLGDPLEVARRWAGAGFRQLHVVDLDAATGRGSNQPMIRDLLADRALEIQVGGGVRDEHAIHLLLEAGAARVMVGTRAIEDRNWLEAAAAKFPFRLVVAADSRERSVTVRGWQSTVDRYVGDLVSSLEALPLAGVLVTAVHREGRMEGTDLQLVQGVLDRTRLAVYAAGGIASMEELRSLADMGVHAAIVGMALYTGELEARALVEEFVS
jgi:phosphoribosylformimino-5-aminoimidazole carboxamide ribotide isomerase